MKASTHDGRFHADEIFALAVLNLFHSDLEIIRSRDETVYKNSDIIVDVGHVYDSDNLIFDHHQRSFALKRESEIFPTHRKTWAIRSIPQKGKKFEYCKLLPAEWGGRQKDLAGTSDVHDALYCHNGCFLAEAKSLEGADKLAGIALEN